MQDTLGLLGIGHLGIVLLGIGLLGIVLLEIGLQPLKPHKQDDKWVVDMDRFVAFVLDREVVLANQFRLFLPRFLQLMRERVAIGHMCCLCENVVFQELNDWYVIQFGCVHPFHDHQLISLCSDGYICRMMSLVCPYYDLVCDWF